MPVMLPREDETDYHVRFDFVFNLIIAVNISTSHVLHYYYHLSNCINLTDNIKFLTDDPLHSPLDISITNKFANIIIFSFGEWILNGFYVFQMIIFCIWQNMNLKTITCGCNDCSISALR